MPYMYTDRPENIDFIADAGIVDQIIDWFGSDIRIAKTDEESWRQGKPKCDGALGDAVYGSC